MRPTTVELLESIAQALEDHVLPVIQDKWGREHAAQRHAVAAPSRTAGAARSGHPRRGQRTTCAEF